MQVQCGSTVSILHVAPNIPGYSTYLPSTPDEVWAGRPTGSCNENNLQKKNLDMYERHLRSFPEIPSIRLLHCFMISVRAHGTACTNASPDRSGNTIGDKN